MRKTVRRKKLFLPLISLMLFLGYMISFPPDNIYYFAVFYLFLFLSLWQILRIFYDNKKSLIYPVIIIVFLLLRQNKIDNILNLLLLLGILVSIEVYFRMN